MPRSTPRFWIRTAGQAVSWLGLVYFLVGFGQYDDNTNFTENLHRIAVRLYVALAGASVYMLARIPYPLVKSVQPAPFDFNARFASYIVYTPVYLRIAKWLLGVFIIVLSMIAGLAVMAVSEGLSKNRAPESNEGWIVAVGILVLGIPLQTLLL